MKHVLCTTKVQGDEKKFSLNEQLQKDLFGYLDDINSLNESKEAIPEKEVVKEVKLAQNGDKAANKDVIERHLENVINVAMTMRTKFPNADVKDFIQIGNLALMEAIYDFDPNYSIAFSKYVEVRARYKMWDAVKRGQVVGVPEKYYRKYKEKEAFMLSLDSLLGANGHDMYSNDDDYITLADTLASDDPRIDERLEQEERAELIRKLLAKLPLKTQDIVMKRVVHRETLFDIAEDYNCTPQNIDKICKRATKFLKEAYYRYGEGEKSVMLHRFGNSQQSKTYDFDHPSRA